MKFKLLTLNFRHYQVKDMINHPYSLKQVKPSINYRGTEADLILPIFKKEK